MNRIVKAYLVSFRLRTLPLSVAGIVLGVMLAISAGYCDWLIVMLLLSTTISLQILSNLCNELGDLRKGTDNAARLGPIRSLQSGILTESNLICTIYLFIFSSIVSGLILLYFSLDSLFSEQGLVFMGLGVASIVAAILYTIGRYAFGYRGLGDLFVFIFFGLVSVVGAYLLMGGTWSGTLLLPASAVGVLCVGVLNINNMRDIENDRLCGKQTLAVRLGEMNAKRYHFVLVIGGFVVMTLFKFISNTSLSGYIYLLSLPLFLQHLYRIDKDSGKALDKQLRTLCLLTLLFALLSGIN